MADIINSALILTCSHIHDHAHSTQAVVAGLPKQWRMKDRTMKQTWQQTVKNNLCVFNLKLVSPTRSAQTGHYDNAVEMLY